MSGGGASLPSKGEKAVPLQCKSRRRGLRRFCGCSGTSQRPAVRFRFTICVGTERSAGERALTVEINAVFLSHISSTAVGYFLKCIFGCCSVFPGRWLGPWAACAALAAAARRACPALGLRVFFLGGTGGGAPLMYTGSLLSLFEEHAGREEEEEGAGGGEQQHGGSHPHRHQAPSLLLLVPLLLGLGKVSRCRDTYPCCCLCFTHPRPLLTTATAAASQQLNPDYLPQLRAIMGMPQSVGLVGGSPGSSLYIVGCQADAVLYLDPHEVQPAAASDADCETFRGDALRTLPLLSLDPSLALGFYCRDAGKRQFELIKAHINCCIFCLNLPPPPPLSLVPLCRGVLGPLRSPAAAGGAESRLAVSVRA